MRARNGLLSVLTTLFLCGLSALAQPTPPPTDLFLAEIVLGERGIELRGATSLTDRDGYDNQPHFTQDGRSILYTSMREGQTDIWRIDLANGRAEAVTSTPESEYSPTPIPEEDAFSVVRVEADGTQRLWRFDEDGGEPRLLLPELAPVGYHAWGGRDRLLLFVLGEPPTLQEVDGLETDASAPRVVATDGGRSLHRVPGREAFAFVQKSAAGWQIRERDFEGGASRWLAPTLPEQEDFAFSPAGDLYMARGGVIYRWQGKAWQGVGDFSGEGITGITRLAISPAGRRLVFVAARRSGS